jgi:hypothetical protein
MLKNISRFREAALAVAAMVRCTVSRSVITDRTFLLSALICCSLEAIRLISVKESMEMETLSSLPDSQFLMSSIGYDILNEFGTIHPASEITIMNIKRCFSMWVESFCMWVKIILFRF